MTGEEVDKQIKARVEWIHNNGCPCILCHTITNNAAVFVANNSLDFGGPEGKIRHVVYALCQDCHDEPGNEIRVEDEIQKSFPPSH